MKGLLIFDSIYLSAIFVCFLFSFLNLFILPPNIKTYYLTKLGNNWNNGPITNIYLSNTTCNGTDYPVINDFWEGTQIGCVREKLIEKGQCGKRTSGKTFPAQPPKSYYMWKGSALCGQRNPVGYLSQKIANKSENCPSGTRSCGIVDSLENVLCMPSATKCPINSIQRNPSIISPSDSVLKFNDGTKFTYSTMNTTNGRVLTDLKISDDIPCADPRYQPSFSPLYPLEKMAGYEKCTKVLGGELYDKRYTYLDTYDKKQFLQENKISDILAALPYNQQFFQIKGTTRLYYRNFIGLAPSCLKTIQSLGSQKELIAQLESQEEKVTVLKEFGLMIFILLIISFSLMFLLAATAFFFINDYTPFISAIVTGFPSILNMGALILHATLLAKISGGFSQISLVNKSECLDSYSYDAISESISSYRTIISLTSVSLVIELGAIIYTTSMAIIACITGKI